MSTVIREPRPASPPAASSYDVEAVRRDFPILSASVYGKPLVYLDNAASAQKPMAVIEAERRVYETLYANIHRGVHWLSVHATDAYDAAREKARAFLNAAEAREIVFVRGTTEAVNLVAQTLGRQRVGPGDEVLITGLEHHSNIVPWQLLCEERGARLAVAPIDDAGDVDLAAFEKLLSPSTRLVSIAHLSNALGTVLPVRRIVELAHARGVPVFVDGAQAAPRMPVDVRALDVDFYAFSSHKIYGPTGVGILYGKAALLEAMPPYQGGGDMIRSVTFEKTTFNELPYKFEAGTPNIAGGIAFGAALDYVQALGLPAIAAHEHDLLTYATAALSEIPGLRIVGTAREKAGVLSFVLDGVHPHDIGTVLDREGIAIRTGHHCAQPVMDRYGLPATARASFGLYNTRAEVDALAAGIHKVIGMFR
jgi:cysteine desulfurase/selenocysteine lyase